MINKGLMVYNESIIGKKNIMPFYFLLRENGKITGGLFCLSVWDWLMIENYYFIRPEADLNRLLQYAEEFAVKNDLHSLGIKAIEEVYKGLLGQYGFIKTGHLEERPPGYECQFMSLSNIRPLKDRLYNNADIICINKEDQDTENFNQMVNHYYIKKIGDISNPEFCIKAVLNNEIVGGIIFNLGWGWLYIDVLWVDKNHRGKRIGHELLKMAEQYALEKGFCRSFLGTAEFQARLFYEKNGYSVFSINYDLPNGYKNFSMKKPL